MSDASSTPVAIGLDFGTESVRAVLIDAEGRELGVGASDYASGQIIETLSGTGERLPDRFALQDPSDWLESSTAAVRQAVVASDIDVGRIVGIGVDFTSCTMLLALGDGTPLCEVETFHDKPLAWPKLWKHHGAISQTQRMNRIATERSEPFMDRYGGIIGLEWILPKLLEAIELAQEVAQAAEVWLEAGDWFVCQLVGGDTETLTCSTCQAGYKGLWSKQQGFASQAYLRAVDERLAQAAASKMPGVMRSPGEPAGMLCPAMAQRMGLPAGIAVSTATIDAHSAVPGVGAAEPGALVMAMGTNSCHMLNAREAKPIAGVAGIVDGGILPGMFGYETGQAAVGYAFA